MFNIMFLQLHLLFKACQRFFLSAAKIDPNDLAAFTLDKRLLLLLFVWGLLSCFIYLELVAMNIVLHKSQLHNFINLELFILTLMLWVYNKISFSDLKMYYLWV